MYQYNCIPVRIKNDKRDINLYIREVHTNFESRIFKKKKMLSLTTYVEKSKNEMFLRYGTVQSSNHFIFLMSESIIPETIVVSMKILIYFSVSPQCRNLLTQIMCNFYFNMRT